MSVKRSALSGAAVGVALAAALLGPSALRGAVPALIDLPDFFWPMKAYTAARWAAGSVPLWNPLSGCGEPWLAQLQTGVFYPGDVPFFLHWPYGPLVAIALHLVLASAGMSAWLDDLGASRVAALAGAAVFAGGGAFLSLVPIYNNFCTAAYLPWLFRGARRAARGGGPAGFTLAAALAFLAGEPALAFFGALAAALVGLATRWEGEPTTPRPDGARAAGRLALGGLLAAGLVGAVAAPFGELLVRSGRIASATREEALARAVGPSDLLDLAVPPAPDAARRPEPGRGGYLLTLALGPLALFLAAGCGAGLWKRPRLLASVAVIGLLGLALSIGERGLLAGVLHASGLFAGLRFPARWFIFFHLFMAVAVAAGLEGWLSGRFFARSGPDEVERPGVVPPAILLAFLAAGAGLFGAGLGAGRMSGPGGARSALVLASAGIGIALLAAHRFTGRPGRRITGQALVGLLAVPLPWISSDPLAASPAADIVARPAAVQDLPPGERGRLLTVVLDPGALARFTAGRGGWTEDTPGRAHAALAGYGNLWHRLATAGSPSPIENVRRARLFSASSKSPANILGLADVRHVVTPIEISVPGARLARRQGGVLRYDLPDAAGRAFFAAEAHAASDDEAFAALRRPDFSPDAVAYVASSSGMLPPPRAGRGYSVARIELDLPERTEIATESSAPGFLVVTRSFDSGWQATVDGLETPFLRVDLAFSGVVVPRGEHRVTLTYRPLAYRAGVVLSLASLLVLAGLVLAGHPPLPEDR